MNGINVIMMLIDVKCEISYCLYNKNGDCECTTITVSEHNISGDPTCSGFIDRRLKPGD